MPRMMEQQYYGPPPPIPGGFMPPPPGMGMPPFPPPRGLPMPPSGFGPPPGMPPPPPHLLPQFLGMMAGGVPPPGMPPPPEGFPQFPAWGGADNGNINTNNNSHANHSNHMDPRMQQFQPELEQEFDEKLEPRPQRTIGISPCQKQIERFRRLLEYAKDNTTKTDKAILSDEQQRDLLEIQRQHHHGEKLSAGSSRRPQKPSTLRTQSQTGTSAMIVKRSVSKKRLQKSVPASEIREPLRRSIHSSYVKSKYDALKRQEEEELDYEPNINKEDIIEQYESPLRTVNHTPGIAHVSVDHLMGRATAVDRTDTLEFDRNFTSGALSEQVEEQQLTYTNDEEDRLRGLDVLHRKLRNTYLSIQRNPQQFLNSVSNNANVPPQSYPGPSHDVLSTLLAKERTTTTTDDGSRAVSFFKSAHSAKQVRLKNDLKQIESQWDRLASIQDSGSKCDFSTPHLSASFATSNTAMDDKRRMASETESRLHQRVQQLKDRTAD